MNIEPKKLLKIKDFDMDFELNEIKANNYEIQISITYKSLVSFQKNSFRILLDRAALKTLINNLVHGRKSSFGNGNIWQANKLFIRGQFANVGFRNVWLYRRIFILGLRIIPTAISAKIITSLEALDL